MSVICREVKELATQVGLTVVDDLALPLFEDESRGSSFSVLNCMGDMPTNLKERATVRFRWCCMPSTDIDVSFDSVALALIAASNPIFRGAVMWESLSALDCDRAEEEAGKQNMFDDLVDECPIHFDITRSDAASIIIRTLGGGRISIDSSLHTAQ